MNSIFIPDSVTNIGEGAFSYCLGLTEILVDENNTYFTSDNGVLFNKNKTELYTYPAGKSEKEYTIPDSVTSILEDAFLFCSNLTSITIPDSVTSIYYTTFVGFTGTIYGYANSAAQTYAEENGYKFESLGAAPEKPKTGSGDIDGSGAVDASDASMVLADYATVATGGASTLSEAQRLAADVNGDNAVDYSDASTILAYYAYTATGGTDSLAEFMKK